jgi:short-subunit dehydrogenase
MSATAESSAKARESSAMRPAPAPGPRCIVITGASSGLGAGLARSYAQPGRVLALIGRNTERLTAVGEACRHAGATVHLATLDVADAVAVVAWLRAFDAAEPVDLLIANAGLSSGTGPDRQPEGMATALAVVRTNLLGVMHTVEPLLPAMLTRGHGHIAVVASVAAYRGLPDSPAYCASKAGVLAYGESLRAALEPRGISVSVIVPGFFTSPMSQRFVGSKPFLVTNENAVERVRRGLQRRARRIVFPRRLAWLLRAADLLPAWLGDRIMRAASFHIVPANGCATRP